MKVPYSPYWRLALQMESGNSFEVGSNFEGESSCQEAIGKIIHSRLFPKWDICAFHDFCAYHSYIQWTPFVTLNKAEFECECVCVNIFKWLLCGAAAAKRWNTLAKLQHCSTKLNVCVYVLWKTSFYLKSQMYGGTAADKGKVNDMEEALLFKIFL